MTGMQLELKNISGQTMGNLGEVVNNAMELVERHSSQAYSQRAIRIFRMIYLENFSEYSITMLLMKWEAMLLAVSMSIS